MLLPALVQNLLCVHINALLLNLEVLIKTTAFLKTIFKKSLGKKGTSQNPCMSKKKEVKQVRQTQFQKYKNTKQKLWYLAEKLSSRVNCSISAPVCECVPSRKPPECCSSSKDNMLHLWFVTSPGVTGVTNSV